MNTPSFSVFQKLIHHKLFIPFVLLIIMAGGFFVRYDDLRTWQKNETQTLYQGRPLLTTFDGYFYLTLARDLLRDEYDAVDEKQMVPQGRPRPFPPPLLSVLGALATTVSGSSLDMVGTILPAALGVLIAIPLYLLGCYYGGRAMGITAALASLFFPYYVYRSNVGWFDTDCMNVTFATFIVYFTVQFSVNRGKRRYLNGCAALLSYLLFLWWWDQAFAVVSIIFLAAVLVSLCLFYRPEKREAIQFFSVLGGLFLCVLLWQGLNLPVKIWDTIQSVFEYIYTSKSTVDIFPNQAITVSEQVRPGFQEIAAKSTGSVPVFIAAAVGLLLLFYKKPKESLFLSVPLALASLSFLFAKRFLIFLNPLTALGLGSLVSFIWLLRKKHPIFGYLTPVLIALLMWPNLKDNLNRVHWPKEPAALVAGMAAAERSTPKDSVVWTWWDHGYNMRYWADRGVIADGSFHTGDISMYNALPLTVSSESTAANFMHFYIHRGSAGMEKVYAAFGDNHQNAMDFLKKIFELGPLESEKYLLQTGETLKGNLEPESELLGLQFYFPTASPKSLYLFLDWRLTVTSYWWYWFGSWDFKEQKGIHPFFELFQGVNFQKGLVTGRSGRNSLQADYNEGFARYGNRKLPLSQITFFDKKGGVNVKSFNRRGLRLDVSAATKSAALIDEAMSNSVFNKLFVQRRYNPKYFEYVDGSFPAWQLWKVKQEGAGG